MPKLYGKTDVEAGAFFTVFGIVTALLSLQYKLGSAAEMGPGFFPLLLGVVLSLVGVAILLKGIAAHGDEARSVPLRPMFFIALSIVLFAVSMLKLGLLFAVPLLVFTSLFASEHFTLKRAAAVSAGLVLFCYVVFVHLLGVSVPMIVGY